MEIKKQICGFTLTSREYINELSGNLNIFEHKKSGARLCFIEREDRNLSFAISFSTPPADDTGIFHIIEHSVLCGSKKFPVKEPFVELLKGSLNTFLNAMTYEDKTVYPVSSRCEKDFYNLVDVYLDAVFNPLMLTDEKIFAQEGWHLEYDEEGISYNGVVFNEMSGAFSSPDELSSVEISRMLFDGTIYGYDSGGSPDAIPSLTYEAFKKAHETYYRPENSLLVLDGSVNLDTILPLIDSYLSAYSPSGFKVEFEAPTPKTVPQKTVYYEAAEDDDGKGRLILSTVFGGAKEPKESLASTILSDALFGSNEAPLKKALLSSGLCEEVFVWTNKGLVNTLTLELHGIEEKNTEKAKELIKNSIENILKIGIEKRLLRATISRLKFRMRERDLGSYPRGIANALAVLELWQYGISPASAFCSEELISELEAETDGNYFEACLKKMTLDSRHRASLLMLPTEGETEISKKLRKSIEVLEKSLCAEDISKIKKFESELKARQSTPDSKEALETVPKLEIADISLEKKEIKTEVFKVGKSEVLLCKPDIQGILYTELYFSAKNLTKDELTLTTLLASLLTNLDTKSQSASEIKEDIKTHLGSFSPNSLAHTDLREMGRAIPLFTLHASALSENAEDIPRLIGEVLLNTDFDNRERIKRIITQIRSATEASVLSSGDGIAGERLEGALTEAGAVNEEIMGITAYKRLKEYEKNFDDCSDSLVSKLKELSKKLFTQNRLILGVGGDGAEELYEKIVRLFPEGEDIKPDSRDEAPSIRREAVMLPLRVGHTAMGLCSEEAAKLLGPFKVARSILSYDYLWNNVRVIGGAYGTGLAARRCGSVILSSYRDPSPLRTLEIFRKTADNLRSFVKSGEELTKYIIGAIGEYDLLLSPRTAQMQALADYVTGWTEENEKKLVRDIINCTAENLISVAEVLDRLNEASFCIVGSRELFEKADGIEIIVP